MPCPLAPVLARYRALPCPVRRLSGLVLLSSTALLGTYALGLLGLYDEAELALIQLLANHPFYMSAQEAQNSLLGHGALSLMCLLLSPYLIAIFWRERRGWVQLGILLLAELCLLVASLSAVFWGGVLNLSAPMLCLLLSWLVVGLTQTIQSFTTSQEG